MLGNVSKPELTSHRGLRRYELCSLRTCMHACRRVSMHLYRCVCLPACPSVCVHAWMYGCRYACIYLRISKSVVARTPKSLSPNLITLEEPFKEASKKLLINPLKKPLKESLQEPLRKPLKEPSRKPLKVPLKNP